MLSFLIFIKFQNSIKKLFEKIYYRFEPSFNTTFQISDRQIVTTGRSEIFSDPRNFSETKKEKKTKYSDIVENLYFYQIFCKYIKPDYSLSRNRFSLEFSQWNTDMKKLMTSFCRNLNFSDPIKLGIHWIGRQLN